MNRRTVGMLHQTEDEVYVEYTCKTLVEQISKSILCRKGEVIDEDLALERARNIAQGLLFSIIRG